MTGIRHDVSRFTDLDRHLLAEGNHFHLHEKLGAHPAVIDGVAGTSFAVWAPNAAYVSVMVDRLGWDKGALPLKPHSGSGIWEGFVPGIGRGHAYKYHIASRLNGYAVDKADPVAFSSEHPPQTASVVWPLDYTWNDAAWMQGRRARHRLTAPMSIYEVHLGSWRRVPGEGNRWLSYREMAEPLARHVKDMGFTHVELLPIAEHPYYASWGYQVTGYFAPTRRYGTPQDLMFLIDYLHRNEIGVILDWVPSHFPMDAHGLSFFDGTHLYEHGDPRQGVHQDWKTAVFNYGRHEVRSFLISNALFWLDKYHIDGLRVDAVASMLYLDYSRKPGEWIPNEYGGRENIEAIQFLRRLNEEVYRRHPDVQTIAEESTAWPMVSRPTYLGGLGFGLKWDMGWMHDTLAYFKLDPIFRKFHHNKLTFRQLYAWSENYVLSLSHDEVVHMKGSLLNKMPGDPWRKFAQLRLLLGSMFAQPGKKLLFMGTELAPWTEWNHDTSLDWHLLNLPEPGHRGVRQWLADLNRLYRGEPALHEQDHLPNGFQWVDANDADQSVTSFVRWSADGTAALLVVANHTPNPRHHYRVGVPWSGDWHEVLNSDGHAYGGSGVGNLGRVRAEDSPSHGLAASLQLSLPPLGIVFLKSPPKPAPLPSSDPVAPPPNVGLSPR